MSEAFFRLFEGLPRQGPGSDACTREALERLRARCRRRRGCSTSAAAAGARRWCWRRALRSAVLAVDKHQPFLDALRAAADQRGLGQLIEVRCADMAAPGVAAGSIDLLWSEGAIYLLGFEEGLRLWRPLLADGGCAAAVSECSWFVR